MYCMSLPRAYLAKKLIQPLPIRGGAVLRTIPLSPQDRDRKPDIRIS